MAFLLVAGLLVLAWKAFIAGEIQFVGFGDPAAYAEMTRSVLDGRGFEVDYISMHFQKFDPGVSHPEESWPPLYPLLIVPFFLLLGQIAFAAKLPSILISCFLLPPITYALAKRISRSEAVALASGISVLLFLPIFCFSLQGIADLAVGFLLIAAMLCAIKGQERSSWYFLMGVLLGLAYLAKASAVAFIIAIVVYYFLCRIWQRPRVRWCLADRRFLISLLVMFMIVLPWLIRNTVHFDDPLYSSNKHISGYAGWEPWEEKTYTIYWNQTPPDLTDKLEEPARLVKTSISNFLHYGRELFFNTDPHLAPNKEKEPSPFSFADISTWWTGLPALLGLCLFLLALVTGRRARVRRAENGAGEDHPAERSGFQAFYHREYGLFLLAGLCLLALLSLFWAPHTRLLCPLFPMVMIMGWTTMHTLVRHAAVGTNHPARIAGAAVLILCLVWASHEGLKLIDAKRSDVFPWSESGLSLMEIGDWMQENAPGSVTLTQHPWGLHFYSEEKTVRLPKGSIEQVLKVARYYKATHIIPDGYDPVFFPWVRGSIPGLERVYSTPGLELFEIDYKAIAESKKKR
jgi:4-amino-4-deoxy-L-arabinose transferase-like glycosyltransferase